MTVETLIKYFFFGAVAAVNIGLAYSFKKKYPQPYLRTLFYYVVIFSAGNFGVRIILRILRDLLHLSPTQMQAFSGFNFVFLLWPVAVINMYLLIKFVNEMLEIKLSRGFKWKYFSGWGVFLVLTAAMLFHILDTGEDVPIAPLMLEGGDMAGIVIRFWTMVYLVYWAKDFRDRDTGRAFQVFGSLWLLGLMTFNFGGELIIPRGPVLIFVSFAYILPALIYLGKYLKKHAREHPGITEQDSMEEVFAKHNISKREQEVVHLITKGKSNREIADELYISISTVKLHTHSIYRKLGIKNRVQLSNFIRNSIKE